MRMHVLVMLDLRSEQVQTTTSLANCLSRGRTVRENILFEIRSKQTHTIFNPQICVRHLQ